jgi:DNA polymerase-3 subunit epsilon
LNTRRQLPRFAAPGCILLLFCGVTAAVWNALTADEKLLLGNILGEHPALILTAAFLFPCAAAIAALWVFRHYVEPLRRLVDEVRVMNLVNPSHRLAPEGSTQIRELSSAINRALDRIQDLQSNVDDEVRIAREKVEEEKAVLEALIQDFPDGVVVCNAEGQILLYNRRARDILTPGGTPPGANGASGGAYVGLGRSVFGFIDRDLVAHALEMIDREIQRGKEQAASRFVTTAPGGELLRVEATPVIAGRTEIRGCILLLHDVSREIDRDARRESLLESLTERLRSSLATVRTAVEILVDHPGIEQEKRERLELVIRDEAFSLSGYLDARRADHADSSGRLWPLDAMLAGDVASAVKQRAERSLDVHMSVRASPAQMLINVDSFTLVQAIVFLTASMKRASGVMEFVIRPIRDDRLASLDLLWRGKPLPAATLREWESSDIRIAGQDLPVTLAEVLRRHDAELWSGTDPDGAHAYIRIVFPSPEPAGARIEWQGPPQRESRPEFYDFDLFALTPGPPALGDRVLTEIPFTAFDTETTGLRPSDGDEIVSIGAVRIVNGRILREETFDHLVDPGRPIPRESTDVHGIDDALVRGHRDIASILPAFGRFAQDTVLVGHNAAFDMKFFQIKERQTGVKLRMPLLDTILLSSVVHPHHDDHSIEGIARRMGVNIVGRHTALGDAIVTGELFVKLIPLLADRGIRTLGQALEASKKSYLARVKY